MINSVRNAVVISASLLLVALAAAAAPAKAGWVPLFNGNDLGGWKANGDEKWTVEQGAIVGESATTKYGYLTTEKTYRDFELRMSFKGEAAGNAGVFFHSRIARIDPEHGPDIEGMQVEVDPGAGKHTGGLYETGGDRTWVAMPTEDGEKALKPGEWNRLEVSVQGNRIVTHLNGIKVVDFTDTAAHSTDGVIGLQVHNGGGVKVRWKDIYIKEE